MEPQAELESLQMRIAKAPTNVPRIMPNTRRWLFTVLGNVGVLKGDRAERLQVWQLVTGRQINSTNDLTDAEARLFIEWLIDLNTDQPRHEAVAAVRAWLTGAGGEGQAEIGLAKAIAQDLHGTENEGEKMEQERTELMELLGAVHVEARTIAYTSFILKGVQINFTMREGATASMVKDLVKEMGEASQWLKGLGAVPVLDRDARANGNGRMASAPQAPQQAPASTSGPPTSPPQQAGGNGDGIESFKVESVVAQVSPNGNRYYAIKGGRCKRHGVTAWPEVAEPQLEQLTGYNPVGLEVGNPWDVAEFGITAVGEIPAGKDFPNKVVTFQ